MSHLNRKDEILIWFKANHVDEKFIIIDDDASLNELPDYLKVHLVMPSPYIGLTEEYLVK
ncbi:MAG: HAD domain-containing protein [Sediminibacterium sp.]